MSDLLDIVARLRAYAAKKAVPITSHRRIALHPHALLFCPLSLAGEDSTIHITALGQIDAPRPHIYWTPDPRIRQDQYLLFEHIADVFEHYVRDCLANHTFPQLWVSSQAAADLVDILADRLRFQDGHPKIQRLGELLTYFAQRADVVGQQALMIAPQALCAHWRTGQAPEDDAHLAAVLTWIDPPANTAFWDALTQAERIPSGNKTHPLFDRRILAPLLTHYTHVRKSQASPQVCQQEAQHIYDALTPICLDLYHLVERTYQIFQQAPLPSLPSLPHLEERECEEFRAFLKCLSKGIRFPVQDSFQGAIYGLATREDAVELIETVLLIEDQVEHTRGYLSGRILTGTITGFTWIKNRASSHKAILHLCSQQSMVRIKPQDEWYWQEDVRLKVEVVAIQQGQHNESYLTMALCGGLQVISLPAIGCSMEFIQHKPDWQKLKRERRRLSQRLPPTPWLPPALHP